MSYNNDNYEQIKSVEKSHFSKMLNVSWGSMSSEVQHELEDELYQESMGEALEQHGGGRFKNGHRFFKMLNFLDKSRF